MKKKWTRRKFLETGLKGSIVVGGGATCGFAAETRISAAHPSSSGASTLSPQQRETLRAAMDEIVPAVDGMPAASEIGGVEYLERVARAEPEVKKALERSLAALDELCRKDSGSSFASLSRDDRAKVLGKLERRIPAELFTTLRDFTYEAYYTQPRVWELIGYELHPTDEAGPPMKPFDESVLANVKKRGKLYREVS
ncbi:MAG: gluconate 2-dehydrogenase subunit 3 family protein [Acidobacteria bacterium]|nr:gluconate 2-dehydrogenase subunit 3 family protein [Acidobacteriota bacterium]